jgi:hypothetical protein
MKTDSISRWTGVCAFLGGVALVAISLLAASLPIGCVGGVCIGEAIGGDAVAGPLGVSFAVLLTLTAAGTLLIVHRQQGLGALGLLALIALGGGLGLGVGAAVVATVSTGELAWNMAVVGALFLVAASVMGAIVLLRARVVPRWIAAALAASSLLLLAVHDQTSVILFGLPYGAGCVLVGTHLIVQNSSRQIAMMAAPALVMAAAVLLAAQAAPVFRTTGADASNSAQAIDGQGAMDFWVISPPTASLYGVAVPLLVLAALAHLPMGRAIRPTPLTRRAGAALAWVLAAVGVLVVVRATAWILTLPTSAAGRVGGAVPGTVHPGAVLLAHGSEGVATIVLAVLAGWLLGASSTADARHSKAAQAATGMSQPEPERASRIAVSAEASPVAEPQSVASTPAIDTSIFQRPRTGNAAQDAGAVGRQGQDE